MRLLVPALAVAALACVGRPLAAQASGAIAGRVTDASSGGPLAGAVVTISDGRFIVVEASPFAPVHVGPDSDFNAPNHRPDLWLFDLQ